MTMKSKSPAPRQPAENAGLESVSSATKPRRRINSRAKGAVGEREFAELLRVSGWPGAKRGQQRSGLEQADVVDGPERVHWEVKRVESLNVWQAFEQAARDARHELPVVAMRRNKSRWLAVLPLEDLLTMLRARECAASGAGPAVRPNNRLDYLLS